MGWSKKKFFNFTETWHLWYKIDKCTEFSSFRILLKKCGKKSDSSLKFQKKITNDFLEFFFPRESFVKWTQIKIKGNSFVNCLLEDLDQFKGNSFIFFKRTYLKKDFVVKKIYVILYKIKQKNQNWKKI